MTGHPAGPFPVRVLTSEEAAARIAELAAVLVDCVAGGASVGLMAPLARDRADAFWREVGEGVAAGDRLLLVAEDPASGDAERLYERLGWTRVGQVPGHYALMPDGCPCDTTIFYKPIAQT